MGYVSYMKMPSTKEDFFIWSYCICLAANLLASWQQTNTFGEGFLRVAFVTLLPATFLFLYWLFVRWVATTAERSGRSFVSFMIFAIAAPLIAWIVVIMFKKPQNP